MPSYSHLSSRVASMLPNGTRAGDIQDFLDMIETLDADCDLCARTHALKASIPNMHDNDVMERLIDAERVLRFGVCALGLTESQIAGIVADAFFGVTP